MSRTTITLRLSLALAAACLALAGPASAASVLYGLGDSVTFGEDDLRYEPSDGDRGYVGRFADALAARNGERPDVRNFAIDGETASSFMTGSGRTPPVVGRTDDILALQNTNYTDAGGVRTQEEQFRQSVAQENEIGTDIAGITVTLGFNELAALAARPTDEALAAILETLDAYVGNYNSVLTTIRDLAPDAPLYLLGYYNPFPADPDSPAAPIFDAAGSNLNGIIETLAGQYDAFYVDVAPAFLGNETAYTFLDEQPAGFVIDGPFGGEEPIGNVHATAAGYDAIANELTAQIAPVPLPAGLPLYFAGLAGVGFVLRRSKKQN